MLPTVRSILYFCFTKLVGCSNKHFFYPPPHRKKSGGMRAGDRGGQMPLTKIRSQRHNNQGDFDSSVKGGGCEG